MTMITAMLLVVTNMKKIRAAFGGPPESWNPCLLLLEVYGRACPSGFVAQK